MSINGYKFQNPVSSAPQQPQLLGMIPNQQPKIDTNLSKQEIEKLAGKKISDKNFNQFMSAQKDFNLVSAKPSSSSSNAPPKISATPTTTTATTPTSAPTTPPSTALKSKELDLQKLQEEIKKATHKNISMDTLKKFAPAFETVQKSISFVAKLNEKRDYDDQHYTVPTSQSLFALTANQIANMPIWRS